MSELAEYAKISWNGNIVPTKLPIPGFGSRVLLYDTSDVVWSEPPTIRQRLNCRNCGAANHQMQCEYCGTLN